MEAYDLGPEDLLGLQQEILEKIAIQTDLTDTLDSLCVLVERMLGGGRCSIMRFDPRAGRLFVQSGPSIQPELVAELNGLVPARLAGSCGTAVHRRTTVIVEDTLSDPRWGDLRDLALTYGIRACWSIPLFSRDSEILGTLATSFDEPRGPSDRELSLLRTAGHLGSNAIQRHRIEADLREQKALLESIIESTEDPIVAKDEEGRYLLANSAEARGLRRDRSEMIGLRDHDIYPPAVARRSVEIDREIMRTGQGRNYEEVFENPLEGRRIFYLRKGPLFDGDGTTKGIITIARDITEMKRNEEALRAKQKLESLGILAGGIAHDFNNLLTGILGNSSMALGRVEPDSMAFKYLKEIERASIRAAELTNQMLAYSGRAEAVKSVVHIPSLVEEVKELLGCALSKKATFTLDIAEDLPDVDGDATQLSQLFMNLFTNASEALEEQPGSIRVSMRCVDRDVVAILPEMDEAAFSRRWISISVADTGQGMSPETQKRIFDPFFSTRFTGRGLGLAATLGIVRGHDGAITVDSREGVGSTFTVYLPAAEERAQVEKIPEEPRPVSHRTVLVIDDEPSVLSLAKEVLQGAGVSVLTACNGLEAVELLSQTEEKVSGALLDLTTPGISGHETYRRLRQIDPDLSIVLSSGYCEPDATQDFADEELAGFLKKPYRPADLLAVVLDSIGP